MNKFVFLDRDGTIIRDKGYVHKKEDLEFLPGALDGLKRMMGSHKLVVVTNQSGIGRGIFSLDDFKIFNDFFIEELKRNEVEIKETLFCPHRPEEGCLCRKPKTGLIENFLRNGNIELDKENCFFIGDKTSDIKLAENLGIKGIMVKTGKAGKDGGFEVRPSITARDLSEAAEYILK